MAHFGRCHLYDPATGKTVAKAQIDIFAIAKVAFLKAAKCLKYVASPHRRSRTRGKCLPVRQVRRDRAQITAAKRNSCSVIDISSAVQKAWVLIQQLVGTECGHLAHTGLNQLLQPIGMWKRVRVKQNKPLPAGQTRGLVISNGKARICVVLHKNIGAQYGGRVRSGRGWRGIVNQYGLKASKSLRAETIK